MVELVEETAQTKSIALGMKGRSGHRAGQHVDVRLDELEPQGPIGGYFVWEARFGNHFYSSPWLRSLLLTVTSKESRDGEQ